MFALARSVSRRHAPAAVPITWEGPLTLTGTSTEVIENRNFKSTDAAVAAVTVNGAKHVTFRNCRFDSKDDCVRSSYAIDAEFYNCLGVPRNPDVAGDYQGYFFNGNPASLIVERCSMAGGGIYINGGSPGLVRIRFNRCMNINGLKSDGSGLPAPLGYVLEVAHNTTYIRPKQFLQLNNVTVQDGEVAWNCVQNKWRQSCTEDLINVISSGGTLAAYLNIHHNLLDTTQTSRPFDITSSSTGIVLEGSGVRCAYVNVDDNVILRTANMGLGMTSADGHHHVNIRRNKLVNTCAIDGQLVVAINRGGYIDMAMATGWLGKVASQAAMLALGATVGQFCYRTDTSTWWDCAATPSNVIGNWAQRATNAQGSTFVVCDNNQFAWKDGTGTYDLWMTSPTQALPGNSYSGNVRLAAPTFADEEAAAAQWFADAAAAGVAQIGCTLEG